MRPGDSSSSRMKLRFLGTRGEIEARTRWHRMHSLLLVSYRGTNVMIDCGLDWLGKFKRLHPDAIVLHTRASPFVRGAKGSSGTLLSACRSAGARKRGCRGPLSPTGGRGVSQAAVPILKPGSSL